MRSPLRLCLADTAVSEYRAWIARYPKEPLVQRQFFEALVSTKQFAEAQRALAEYRRAFPEDTAYPVQAMAELASKRGSEQDALYVYDQNFRPLWPQELVKSYFAVLKQTHSLRRFLDVARSQIQSGPYDIKPAAKVYDYFQQQGNLAGSLRALYEYRQRKDAGKSPWTADELWTLGQLFEQAHNYDEAARSYYELSRQPGANHQEQGLAAIAKVLLIAPEQPIRIGLGDLSFYRDIASMDPGPGFLNGVLSLLFNSTSPEAQYTTENQASTAYFHRAKASELISEFDKRFPSSPERAGLHSRLIAAYVTYGDDAAVLRAGSAYLKEFANAADRTQVALQMADAYARQNRVQEEFAVYDGLLNELSLRSDHVPLGEHSIAEPARQTPPSVRSPEYARVLDHYAGRLVTLKRLRDALALYRREIDRNPNDPGLYEKLAGFLDQNKMGADVEQVYKKAMAQFPDRSWSHKLARWYLRRKQTAQFDALTRDVVTTFSGTELVQFLAGAQQQQPLAAVLFRQVNVYAHQRFPNDLAFVRNLLNAYSNRGTADPVSAEALLRRYWFYAPDLRDRFFEMLSRTGKLKTEFAAISKPDAAANPAGAQFAAEASAWQSHFETAAPLFREVAQQYPGEPDFQTRASALYRSLATYDPPGDRKNMEIAAVFEENVTKIAPRDRGALAAVGDIFAERDRFAQAKPLWDRIATIEPGKPEGYLDAATVFWDYYRFEDALRLIAEGRKNLGDPKLFSYETGAIYENRREYGRAIDEYAKAVDPQSRARLIQLSLRPNQRGLIDEITAKAASGANAPLAAVMLRTDVLTAQRRTGDLRSFLLATASITTAFDVLQYLDATGSALGLDKLQEQSKLRRIGLSADPIERMQAQIDLVHFYEGHRDMDRAGRVIAELYREHPAVLGVVRAAIDYYWRNKDSKRAVDVLAAAAAKSQSEYRDPFTLEAARKATDSGDYQRARGFCSELLKRDPFRSEYVAAMADTYARQSDDKGLRDFYTAQLAAAPGVERKSALRRGLIPVLTRLKDYAGAVDQYVEILNQYPEDSGLVQEAANYAAIHGRSQQLVDYYGQTRKRSPRDYRWAMLAARIDVQLEDFPAAISAYRQAAEIRPDRIEFLSERAGLEERLLRFDEAAATYTKLYDLSYHNSQWMLKLAEVRARQEQSDAVIKALNLALIDGRSAKPEAYFTVAQKLESWNMLPQAKDYAQKGVDLAGPALLTEYSQGAQTYARVMTRLRQYSVAYQRLAPLTPGKSLNEAVQQAMGTVVAQSFTPEEKSAFAAFIGPRLQSFLPAIRAAGLLDLQARALAKQPDELIPLQRRRLQFGELAAQLEAYWKGLPNEAENRDSYLDMAAANYKLAGDAAGELRVLTIKNSQGSLAGESLQRFAQLLSRTPARLAAVVSSGASDATRNGVANYMVEHGTAGRALQTIAARGKGLPPVWTRAYTGLTGLYFASNMPQIATAFREALGTASIGERLGKPVHRNQQIAGDTWFYYGSRFGEYLGNFKQTDAEDYLPSGIEGRPGSAGAYFDLGEYYRQAGQLDKAMVEYRYTLQLDNRRVDVHDRIAVILAHQGKRNEAIEEFRAALNASAVKQDQRGLGEAFWTDLRATIEDLGTTKLLDPVRSDVDRVLRTYIRRNGNYRAEPFLEAIIAAAGESGGVSWVIDLSAAAPERAAFLSAIVGAEWIPETQRAAVYRALIDSARKPELQQDLRRYQTDFATYLVEHKRAQEAKAILSEVPENPALEIRIAAQLGGLTAVLNRYEDRLEEIRNAASDLEKAGNHAAAREALDFVYTHQIEARQWNTATFLGLAEIRLEQGDVAGATSLLRRMTMVVGEPFENLMDAAALLTRTGHPDEAKPFLEQRRRAVPWDAAAKVKDERPVTAAQVEKPYYYEQRLQAAAQTSDLAVKIRLLRGAIAIDPGPEQPRLDLIRAALDAKRWQLAVAAAPAGAPDSLSKAIAQAHENLGELAEADELYRKAGSTADVKRIQVLLARQAANAARRPVVTEHLEQDHPVRPRLLAAAGGAQ